MGQKLFAENRYSSFAVRRAHSSGNTPASQNRFGVLHAAPHPAAERFGLFARRPCRQSPTVSRTRSREHVDQDRRRGRDVQALDHAAHRDAQEFVGRSDHLVGNPGVLGAEDQRERSRARRRTSRASRPRGGAWWPRSGSPPPCRAATRLGRRGVAAHVDPLVACRARCRDWGRTGRASRRCASPARRRLRNGGSAPRHSARGTCSRPAPSCSACAWRPSSARRACRSRCHELRRGRRCAQRRARHRDQIEVRSRGVLFAVFFIFIADFQVTFVARPGDFARLRPLRARHSPARGCGCSCRSGTQGRRASSRENSATARHRRCRSVRTP